MIDHLTHLYKIGTPPFQSLSSLPGQEALQIMKDLYIEGSVFWERFKDPGLYLRIRRQVEEWLRRDFIAKGGQPQETYPFYMVLGRSKWMRTSLDPTTLTTTTEINIPLSIFTESDLSFTFPDSMVSWMLAQEKNPQYYLPGIHGTVFTLPEIRSMIESRGMPGETWGTDIPAWLANYIEAQVWNHKALSSYLQKAQALPG